MNTTQTAAAELRHVAPTAVVIDANIRQDADSTLTPEFIDSIRDGIRQPALGYLAADGTVTIIDGQRRTLAARAAELPTMPVYIVERPADLTADQATIERVTDQLVTNEHRAELTRRDQAQAVEQLALAGLSPTKIAKRLSRKKAEVDKILAVAASANALDILDTTPDLTIEQAATLAEWDHDTDAASQLLEAANQGRFEHVAAVLEATREGRALIQAEGQRLEAEGIQWRRDRPQWNEDWTQAHMVIDPTTGDTPDIAALPVETKLAMLTIEETEFWADSEGQPVDEDLIDWSIEDQEDTTDWKPAEGMIDPRTITEATAVSVDTTWFVTDYQAHGLIDWSEWNRRQRNGIPAGTTAEDAEQARKDAERETRRRTIALNKMGAAATDVRRAKLAEWLTRKTLPKEHRAACQQFITATMWSRADLLGHAPGTAAALLGSDSILTKVTESTPERAQVINLGIALAAHEGIIKKDSWRDGYHRQAFKPYFTFLTEVTGYTLAEVEKAMTGQVKPEDIDLS